MRPETAQGAYVAFKRVLATCRKKLPFGARGKGPSPLCCAHTHTHTPSPLLHPPLRARAGVGQMGRAFRNEISPGQFLFRTREFEQLELQYFTLPEEAAAQCVALRGI